jgi:DNA-binding beta-propeller fold protein YncE
MRNAGAVLLVAAAVVCGQDDLRVEFRHLYTFGSRQGIHPNNILSRRPVIAALGRGEHPYGLGFPVAVTTDFRNRLWITDSATCSVHIFDRKAGAYRAIRKVGGVPLEQPSGIAADTQGRVYLADSRNGGVFVFDEKGEYDRMLVKPGKDVLEKPTAVALSENGRTVYVADPPRNVVVAFNQEGEVILTIQLPPELTEPSAISVADNQIYVLGNRQHKVLVFTPAGLPRGERRWDDIPFPSAIAYDGRNRRFLVADPRWGVVQVFDEAGRNVGVFGQLGEGVDQVERVDSLYAGRNGLIYLVDSHDGKVLVFGESRSR